MVEVSSVRTRARLMHPRVVLLPSTPPRVIAQLPQVKLRLSEPDINGRFDRCDDLRFSKGNTERAEKRSDHGAVTLWLHSLGQQQARPGAILPHGRAILSFDGSHMKNLSGHPDVCVGDILLSCRIERPISKTSAFTFSM